MEYGGEVPTYCLRLQLKFYRFHVELHFCYVFIVKAFIFAVTNYECEI